MSLSLAAPQPASLFLTKLAPELRNLIYAHVFLRDSDSKVHYQLLLTCRLIFEEARHVPVAVNWHNLQIRTHYNSVQAWELRFLLSNEPYEEWGFDTDQEVIRVLKRYSEEQLPFLYHVNIVGELVWFEKEAMEHLIPLREAAKNVKKIKLSMGIWTLSDLRGCSCQVLENKKFPGIGRLLEMFSDVEEIQLEYTLPKGKTVECTCLSA